RVLTRLASWQRSNAAPPHLPRRRTLPPPPLSAARPLTPARLVANCQSRRDRRWFPAMGSNQRGDHGLRPYRPISASPWPMTCFPGAPGAAASTREATRRSHTPRLALDTAREIWRNWVGALDAFSLLSL